MADSARYRAPDAPCDGRIGAPQRYTKAEILQMLDQMIAAMPQASRLEIVRQYLASLEG